MNSFLVAAALSTCATAVNIAVDGIIVGRFVSPDALSAVNLYSPYAQTLSIILLLLLYPASSQTAYFIGERNREKAGRFISTSLLSILVAGVLLSVSAFFFTDSYVFVSNRHGTVLILSLTFICKFALLIFKITI